LPPPEKVFAGPSQDGAANGFIIPNPFACIVEIRQNIAIRAEIAALRLIERPSDDVVLLLI
jgi:hypothetical protein